MPASPTSEWICKPSPQPPPEAAAVEISGVKQLWGSQSWLPPAFSRRLEFLHFGTDFLTVPPRIDQAEAHALYRSEEHTSELQSLRHLVCRLLLEKKNNTYCHTPRRTQVYEKTPRRPRGRIT